MQNPILSICSSLKLSKEAQDQLASLFSPSCIDMLFRKSGASVEALNIKKSISPLRNLDRSRNILNLITVRILTI